MKCCSIRLPTFDSYSSDRPKVPLSYISATATDTPGQHLAHHSRTNCVAAVTFLNSYSRHSYYRNHRSNQG